MFDTNGGFGKECDQFIKKLAKKMALKSDESYASVIIWFRTKLSYCILKFVNTCVRGSRRPLRNNPPGDQIGDFRLNAAIARL